MKIRPISVVAPIIASAVLTVALYSALSREPALGLIKANAVMDAFTIALAPLLIAAWLSFWAWEALGRRPSIALYALAAPLIAFAAAKAFFAISYGYGPVWTFGREEISLAASFILGGAGFAFTRKIIRNSV